MKNQSPQLRFIEEKTHHLYMSHELFELKNSVVDVDAFLLMFNPLTKYVLCRYWAVLEAEGYDPVVEYNKSLETFDMHHATTPEEIFAIILQISRFLKEFGDFENDKTPKFEHPLLRGKKMNEEDSQKAEIEINKNLNKNKSFKLDGTVAGFLDTFAPTICEEFESKSGENESQELKKVQNLFTGTREYFDTRKADKKKQVNKTAIDYFKDIGIEYELIKMNMLDGYQSDNKLNQKNSEFPIN